MISFSERQGLIPERTIQIDSVDEQLRNRLWNYFFNEEFIEKYDGPLNIDWQSSNYGIVEDMLDLMGYRYEDPDTSSGHLLNKQALEKILISCGWNYVYDFIEKHLSLLDTEDSERVAGELNELLEAEKSGYRIVREGSKKSGEYIVSPITDKKELESITDAMNTGMGTVDTAIQKALALYSDRKAPDYANSIKESISAVESMLAHITGKETTLSNNLKQLKKLGMDLHPAFEDALNKLYGFTSDSSGIRHGGFSEPLHATEQNARFMLVICSAFLNYMKQANITEGTRNA